MKRFYEKNELVYVSPGSARFDMEDILFLLPWLYEMREGTGPVPPESGYVGGNRTGIKAYGRHEAWCQVAGEIDRRLARCGLDRFLVEQSYCQETDDETLAAMVFLPVREIQRRIRSAVGYISSGPCPRWQNCVDCLKRSRCRRKKRVGVTYREWKNHRRKISR